MTVEAERYLTVAAMLFVLGAIGFLTRRNLIVMVLSAEMMLHGVALTLVTFSRVHHNLDGQAFTIFVLTVAACEAGLALALILALYQRSSSLDVDLWTNLREADFMPPKSDDREAAKLIDVEEFEPLPTLAPAGREPVFRHAHELAPSTPPRPEVEAEFEEYNLPSAR